jgi:hypothetical protein
MGGNRVERSAQVALQASAGPPQLVALVLPPGGVPERTAFRVAAVPLDPRRVTRVEFSVAGGPPVVATAPSFIAELTAPAVDPVAGPVTVSVTGVAYSGAQAGPPLSADLLVRSDAGAPDALVVGLAPVGGGVLIEGTAVPFEATLAARSSSVWPGFPRRP